MFTAHRTERDGWLIAYEGEIMSEEEARRRGLIDAPQPKPKAKPKTQRKKTTKEN